MRRRVEVEGAEQKRGSRTSGNSFIPFAAASAFVLARSPMDYESASEVKGDLTRLLRGGRGAARQRWHARRSSPLHSIHCHAIVMRSAILSKFLGRKNQRMEPRGNHGRGWDWGIVIRKRNTAVAALAASRSGPPGRGRSGADGSGGVGERTGTWTAWGEWPAFPPPTISPRVT